MQALIKNTNQYEDALERAYELMQKDLIPNSAESDELETISVLIKTFEEVNFPVPKPDKRSNKPTN